MAADVQKIMRRPTLACFLRAATRLAQRTRVNRWSLGDALPRRSLRPRDDRKSTNARLL